MLDLPVRERRCWRDEATAEVREKLRYRRLWEDRGIGLCSGGPSVKSYIKRVL